MLLDNEYYMRMALRQAQRAYDAEEVPVGAIVIHENQLIGQAHNQVELLKDATAHAEMIAMTQAASALGDWRLNACTLYVTKEPCPMCAGAIINARVGSVVWGMTDPQRGGAKSLFNMFDNEKLNHRVELSTGVLEDECRSLMQSFFKACRTKPSGAHKAPTQDPA